MEPAASYQHTDVESNDDGATKRWPWGKLLIGFLLIAIIAFVIVDSLTTKYITTGFQIFLEWIENNLVAGFFAFVGVYFIATVAFIPGSILTLGSGFIFGKAAGLGPGVALASVAVFIGASLGEITSFFLGRYLLRNFVERKLVHKYPIIKALDETFDQKGLRILVLLRLSPIIPFNALNYIAGVTSMRVRDYVLAFPAILPGTILYCFVGATAGSLTESEDAVSGPVAIASIVVGIVFGLLGVFAISYYAKKEFNKIVAEKEALEFEQPETTATNDGSVEKQIGGQALRATEVLRESSSSGFGSGDDAV